MKHYQDVLDAFELPELLNHQFDFATTRARYPLAIGAPGSGKSRAGICRSLFLSMDTPYFGNLAGNYGIIGRQSRTDLVDTTMQDFIDLLPDKWIRQYPKKPDYKLIFKNWSLIQFVPLEDIGRFKSRSLGFAYFEEIDETEEKIFEEIAGNRLRKMETKWGNLVNFHTAFGVCNPTKGWIYDTWGLNEEKLQSRDMFERRTFDPDYLVIHSSTYDNAANLPDDYIAKREKFYGGKNTKKGQMYLLGMWGGTESDIYPFDYDSMVNEVDLWPPLEWETVAGADHGWGKGGASCIVFMALERLASGRTKVHVFDEIYLDQEEDIATVVKAIDEHTQFHAIKRAETSGSYPPPERAMPSMVVHDPRFDSPLQRTEANQAKQSIADVYIQRAHERGMSLSLIPGDNSVLPGIDRVKWLMALDLIKWNPRCVKSIKQHKNYVWEKDKRDTPKKGQIIHACDATRYPIMKLNTLYHFPIEEIQETLIQRIKRRKLKARVSSRRELGLLC